MANSIQFKRGLQSTIPAGGQAGEPLFSTDEGRFFIAVDGTTKREFARADAVLKIANNLSDLASPSSARTNLDVYSKAETDGLVQGVKWKDEVRVISTTDITLSGTQVIDGVSLAIGDRVLVAGQTDSTENGVYVCASGAWVRSADADSPTELKQMAVFVSEGTAYSDTGWVLITDGTITLGTSSLDYTQFTGLGSIVAGEGLKKTGNELALDLSELAIDATADGTDYVITYDGTGAKRVTKTNFLSDIDQDSKQLLVSANDTTEGYLFDKVNQGSGIAKTIVNPNADEELRLSIDIPSVTIETSIVASDDYVLVQDASASSLRRSSVNDLVASARIDGGTW